MCASVGVLIKDMKKLCVKLVIYTDHTKMQGQQDKKFLVLRSTALQHVQRKNYAILYTLKLNQLLVSVSLI